MKSIWFECLQGKFTNEHIRVERRVKMEEPVAEDQGFFPAVTGDSGVGIVQSKGRCVRESMVVTSGTTWTGKL